MTSLLDDISAGAEWIAEALRSSGYRADFAPASLWEVERFFEDQTQSGEPRRGGLLAEETGRRLFSLGAYVGEVIRHAVGGEWADDDSDPEGELNVALTLSDGSTVWPVQRVMNRLQDSEDSIAAYAAVLGVELGSRGYVDKTRRFPAQEVADPDVTEVPLAAVDVAARNRHSSMAVRCGSRPSLRGCPRLMGGTPHDGRWMATVGKCRSRPSTGRCEPRTLYG